MTALVVPPEHGPWAMCPRCRIYVDRLTAATYAAVRHQTRNVDVRCPWCHLLSTLPQWLEAGQREMCECGCPKAAHAGWLTSDGEPPGSSASQVVRVHAAPCLTHGCVAMSGAREVRQS